MTTIRIQNDRKRFFAVRIIREGDAYGRNDCLVHNKEDALVEFYDATYVSDVWPDGQFVTRYYASTLLDVAGYSDGGNAGLCLDGGVPEWQIDGRALGVVEAFLRANG